MKFHGVEVYTNNDYQFMRPLVYTNNAWKEATVWIYTGGQWKMIGGACTLMIPFKESGGQDFYVGGGQFFVPKTQVN